MCETHAHVQTVSIRATAAHNIGYCLHAVGEFEQARPYYEEAIAGFSTIQRSMAERYTIGWILGDVNKSRILFIKEKLLDLDFHRDKPDTSNS